MTPARAEAIAHEVWHRACQRWGHAPRGVTFRDAFVAEMAAALVEAARALPPATPHARI